MKIKSLLSAAVIIGLTLLFFWKILLTNLILVGTDTFLYFYPYKAYATESLRSGRIPLWNPHLFMGAPLLANSQVGLFYPLNWPLLWLDVPTQFAWSIGLHISMAGIFMLMFCRIALRLSWLATLTAALVFAFGGYLGAQVEHLNQLQGAVWLPLLILLYDTAIQRRNPLWFLLMAVVVATMLMAGHAQTVFIVLFGVGLYGLMLAYQSVTISRTAGVSALLYHLVPLALVSLSAAALAAVQLLPTAELSALSIRQGGLTFQEVVSFSTNPTTLHYTLLPPYGLDLSQIMGPAFSEWVAYIGLTGVILALLGSLAALHDIVARRFIMLTLCGLGLSFGLFLGPLYLADSIIGIDSQTVHLFSRLTHPYYLLYYFVPGFALFRVPARWLLLYSFGIAVLAGYGMALLRQPSRLSHILRQTWVWLRGAWWRITLMLLSPMLVLMGLLLWHRPSAITLTSWLAITLINLLLIGAQQRLPTSIASTRQMVIPISLMVLLTAELFIASQTLNYNEPTAPQAYHSMRNAVAYLEAVKPETGPPDRFLSLSGTVYDPGDKADMERIFSPHLSPKGMEQLLVASKQKEVLFFNLPLIYGLHSVDGYDGGILPLAQFVTLQRLFLPPDDLSTDGRLREKLRYVPDNRLLSMLNTRWIITDKVFDAWIEGIFYDLQFPAELNSGEMVETTEIPTFPATAIGLVSHLVDAKTIPTDTPIAQLTLHFADGSQSEHLLLTGRDTAEALYDETAAHPQGTVGVGWPYGEAGVSYITRYRLKTQQPLVRLTVTALQPQGVFVLRGISLIHEPTTTSRSVLLSTAGDYQRVHSGDVKMYENRGVMPRAYLVHQRDILTSELALINRLKEPTFDPRLTFIDLDPTAPPTTQTLGQPAPTDAVTILSYQAEQVEIEVTMETAGWLILSDTMYPGWQATVDGQPVPIITANLMFRAVELPAGRHIVRFQFKPTSYQRGLMLSGLTLCLMAVVAAYGLWIQATK